MLGSLVMHEKISTTEAKAKEIKSRIDRIINIAKNTKSDSKKLAATRELRRHIPLMAVKKLSGDFLDKVEGKNSGFSRVIKLAPRKSDGARMAVIELITK
jgi:large subunit ribosomal protein L17